jgi:hypothetical protein
MIAGEHVWSKAIESGFIYTAGILRTFNEIDIVTTSTHEKRRLGFPKRR